MHRLAVGQLDRAVRLMGLGKGKLTFKMRF